MGQPVSHSICCSLREKQYEQNLWPVAVGPPQFHHSEVEVQIEQPRFMAYGPLWHKEAAVSRRLAVASKREVHVYRLPTDEESHSPGGGASSWLSLEHTLTLPENQEVTCIHYSDDTNSRNLVVAYGPIAGLSGAHRARVWSCEEKSEVGADKQEAVNVWHMDRYAHSLDDHNDAIVKLASSQAFFVTADSAGSCGVWQKNKGFVRRSFAKLHNGSIADLAADRFFVYSAGQQDLHICVWAVPDLAQVISVQADLPKDLFPGLSRSASLASDGKKKGADMVQALPALASSPRPACRLSGLTALRRPLSRWAGSQGSSRSAKAPKGTLFVAGVFAENCEVAGEGAGVLMELSLGEKPVCQTAQIAHDSPIVSLAYGPYDNGPLITADTRGVFRVWDCVPRLMCSQHVEFQGVPGGFPAAVIAVEPHCGLYSSLGDKRLVVWRRSRNLAEYGIGN